MKSKVASTIVSLRMPIVLLLLLVAATILTKGTFARADNLINVARQISFEAMIAFGMTFIIITGGIDLSVGSLVALCGVLGGLVMKATLGWPAAASITAGLVAAIALGASTGVVSGTIITRFAIPPFIVTLAAMLIARGFAFILCAGQPVYELPPGLAEIGRGFVMEGVLGRVLPLPVLIMLIAFVLFHVLLTRTVFGRGVIAVGSNEEASRLAGIHVRRTRMIVYLVTGALCGLVGLLYDAKLMAADPKVGEMWELNVIAAVVVGGTSLFGGSGTICGTLVGALIIGVLNNSLNLMHVEHFWQKVVLGAVLLAASLLDGALRKLAVR
jgi:ribose transport system permease protein